MKVIHVLHELKFSGAEIMYVAAAPLFIEKGCELTVVATANEVGEYAPFFENAGFTVKHLPCPPTFNLWKRIKYVINFVEMLKAENFDVVHNHSSAIFWLMSFCARVSSIRCVYTFHNVFPTHFYSYYYHIWLRWSAKHLLNCYFQTISDSVHDHELRLYRNKSFKIYNWYDNTRFQLSTIDEKKKLRDTLNISANALVIISVGGCSSIKRHIDIIKAIPFLLTDFPNLLYLHLGIGTIEEDEKKMAIELGIDTNIRFCGNKDNVRDYLLASDIYLMTSTHEGISLTTIEAMACNIPTILYNVPGLRDFNKENECSLLIDEDSYLLANSVVKLYRDVKLQQKLTSNAKEFIDRNFDININVEKIYNLYLTK